MKGLRLVYMQANSAPDCWFTGIGSAVGRVLVTTGGYGMLWDDIIDSGECLMRVFPDVGLDVDDGGLHDDGCVDQKVECNDRFDYR